MTKAKYYLFLKAILQFQGFIGPVLFVFYTHYMNLNTDEYLLCDALLFIVMSICEIPSGVIADYMGRKRALIISQVMILLGMLLLLILNSFTGAIIVAFIYGIFGALESGVDESIIYELFENHKNLKEYEYIQAKLSSVSFIISILYAISSGYLIKYMITLPIILDAVVCVILLFSTCFLLDDNKKYQKSERILPGSKEVYNVIYAIIVVTFLSSCSRVMFSFYQPVLIGVRLPVTFLGYASAIYSIVSAFSSFLYKYIRVKLSIFNMYILIILLQFISSFGVALCGNFFVLLFILGQQFQRGLMGTFLYMQVNRYIDSKKGNRVSLMSIMYSMISIMTALSLFFTSYITKYYNLKIAMLIYVCLLNALLIMAAIIFKQKNDRKLLIRYDENVG